MHRTVAGSLLGLLGLGGAAWAAARGTGQEMEGAARAAVVTVVGAGEATARPDTAQVEVGVITEAPTAGAALDANNAAMHELRRILASHGVAERDLQTTSFDVWPRYAEAKGGERLRITGYRVGNEVRVRVRQLPRLGGLLDALVQGGANQVRGVSFTLADPGAALDRARDLAIADARRKAERYAHAAGARLGEILVIQDEAAPRSPIGPMALSRVEGGEVPIAPGEQELAARVVVSWRLEPDAQERQPVSGRERRAR